MNRTSIIALLWLLLVAACSGDSKVGADAGVDASTDAEPDAKADAGDGAPDGNPCGDGKKDVGELCDGTDVGGATCADMVATGWIGTVGCTAQCVLDTTTCTTPATTYNALSGSWTTFDVNAVNASARGYAGGVFDGRYVYLVPSDNGAGLHGLVTRYDSQAPFNSASSWQTFDVTTVSSSARGFAHGAFDGRYLYLVPFANGLQGTIARYDTQAAFGSASSWSTVDLTTFDGNARGFGAAAFDGRYVYLAQEEDVTKLYPPGGYVARYDTKATFGSAGSWSFFDVSTVSPNAQHFFASVFDGRYLYLVPISGGAVARYDTQAPFQAAGSWSTFGTSMRFLGGAFDGRYVYFVPSYEAFGLGNGVGQVMRYDTQLGFTSSGSWSTFDVSTVDASAKKGYRGAVFDGRFLFLVPYYDANTHGFVARYDTQAAFNSGASWNVFDLTSVDANAKGFHGGVFDGKYAYLVPGDGSLVARFDAKTPAWLPKGWNASFF